MQPCSFVDHNRANLRQINWQAEESEIATIPSHRSSEGRPCDTLMTTDNNLVHGMHVIFDRATLAPVAVLDGTALTTFGRRPCPWRPCGPRFGRFQNPLSVVIFGLGPQGVGHLDATRRCRARW